MISARVRDPRPETRDGSDLEKPQHDHDEGTQADLLLSSESAVSDTVLQIVFRPVRNFSGRQRYSLSYHDLEEMV